MKFQVCILALVLLAAVSRAGKLLDGPYGPDLINCKRNWVEVCETPKRFTDCMLKLLLANGNELVTNPEGIPLLGIPSFNPMVIERFDMDRTDLPVKGSATNIKVYNVSNSLNHENTTVTFDPEKKLMTIKVAAKLLYIECDVVVKIYAYMRDKKAGGLIIEKAVGDLDIGSSSSQFQSDNPDDPIAKFMNIIADHEAMVPMIRGLLPPFAKQFAALLGKLYHQGWKRLEDL
ncbi:unnamed protein product [Notodromas monacha]|uniref:Uncharacterized protein n=1 Tax=Notodromas monacha TaxID=399045 RepID=A0A7R9BTH5_9CRUS|nr:unnamed protein product [Notodromas monacha]CAG0919910.1 unnamed protein product [Notodromas monacha]